MANQSVEHSGLLYEHPLAELIREARAAGLSGAFRLARDSVKSVIYFDNGEVLFAISNVRTNRLSERARKWNFVTEHQLNKAGSHASDLQLGVALVESGALTDDRLAELLSLQTASVLRPMLLWTDGTWSFDPRVRLAEVVRVQLDLRELLFESSRRLPPEFIEKRFGNTNEVLTVTGGLLPEIALQPVEAYLLSRIESASIRLHELFAICGLPEIQTLTAVYSLSLSGFLERERWPRAFSDETVKRFKAVADAITSREKEAPKPAQPKREQDEVRATESATHKAPKLDEKLEIEQFVNRVEAAEDFYEVLGVTPSADASTVKRTYHALARRFHPDRFHKEAGTPFHARLQTIFARVAQAYEMLKDSTLRASYDLRLQTERRMRRPKSYTAQGSTLRGSVRDANRAPGNKAPKSADDASTTKQQTAEEAFQKGMSALDAGNISLAVALFAEAARRAPKEARYRAYYGRTLSSHKQKRHQAEAELQAAISLDTNNAAYHLMLAELYRENGMRRRAQSEAQRALVIDPQNLQARRLLEDLSDMN